MHGSLVIRADFISKGRSLASPGPAANGQTLLESAKSAPAASMRSGHPRGAVLYRFETEPPTAEAAAIFDGLSNLVLTPHIAGVTQDSNVRVSRMIADTILDRLGKS